MLVYSNGGFADDGAARMFMKAAALACPDVVAQYSGPLVGSIEDRSVMVTMLREVPLTIEKGTVMAAMMKRGPRGYVSLPRPLDDLGEGSRVVSCVPVAVLELRERFPMLDVDPVDSAERCLSILENGEAEAVVLPEMEVLLSGIGMSYRVPDEMLTPAASQGVVAVFCNADDDDTLAWARSVNHPVTRIEVGTERGIMKMMGAGPFTPVGVKGTLNDMFVHVQATSYACPNGPRKVDDYVAIDYVMDDLLDIADYLAGKR